MGLNIELLRESFGAIAPHAEVVIDRFYQELFTRFPDSQALFENVNMAKQKKALFNSFAHIVEFLDDSQHLPDYLRKMGARHSSYGTKKEHFNWVGESLLATFAYFFDTNWTPELNEAWSGAFAMISDEMIKGMQMAESELKKPEVQAPRIDRVVHELTQQLFSKAIDEAFRSESLTGQVRAKVQELIHRAITEEANKILTNYRGQPFQNQ